MTAIIPFTFETSEVRSIIDGDGNPWFIASDIAKALGYSRPNDAVSAHCKKAQRIENIGYGETPYLQNQTLIIPQSDVIRLVSRSKLPSAERFQDWLFEEVVPSIMKTGGYQTKAMSPAEMLVAQAQMMLDVERRQHALEARQDATESVAHKALHLAAVAEAKAQATAIASDDYSVMAWGNLHGFSLPLATAQDLGRRCAALSRSRGLPIGRASDPRFGYVKTYMREIVEDVFSAYYLEAQEE